MSAIRESSQELAAGSGMADLGAARRGSGCVSNYIRQSLAEELPAATQRRPAVPAGPARGSLSPRPCLGDGRVRPASHEVDQAVQDPLAVRAQGAVLVLVRDPGPKAADLPCGLLGKGSLDVQVVDVDRRRDRNLV